jgi:hypothetical protein
MRKVMRTGSLGLLLTATGIGTSPGLAQDVEQVAALFPPATAVITNGGEQTEVFGPVRGLLASGMALAIGCMS